MNKKESKRVWKLSLELTPSDWIASAILILVGMSFMYFAFSMLSDQQHQISTLNEWIESGSKDINIVSHMIQKDMILTYGFMKGLFILSYSCFFLLVFYFLMAFLRTRRRQKKANSLSD